MNISAVYAPENSSMDFGLVDPESYLIRRDSVSRILAIARELHISLDAIAYAGTSRPNSVSADVLEFFSGKDDAESLLCMMIVSTTFILQEPLVACLFPFHFCKHHCTLSSLILGRSRNVSSEKNFESRVYIFLSELLSI